MQTTLKDILLDIQVNVDMTTEDWDDEDTIGRIRLVNEAIRRWGRENVTRWEELFDTVELGEVGEDTTSFPLPDNYKLLEAVLNEEGELLSIKKSSKSGKSGRYFYVTGNAKDGHKLNLGWKPESDDKLFGAKIRAKIYTAPTLLKDPDDVPQMSEPDYIVNWVSAEVLMDDDMNKFSIFSGKADNDLANMREVNIQITEGEAENVADDDDFGFGV